MGDVHGPKRAFVFAFNALPPIIFVSSFFTVLYYFGVLQFVVRLMSKAMVYLLGTSGAETLSVSANVFMGQTEAPLIIKPYVPGMTQSELLTMMVGAVVWFFGCGLMFDVWFIYPPFLFIAGLVCLIKGIASGKA